MALIEFIAQLATVVTLISFLTGIPICRSIRSSGSTNNYSSLPFVVGNLCGYLWLRYGLLLNDSTMIFINTIGFTLQSIYLLWFYYYTVPKRKINIMISIVISFIVAIHFFINNPNNNAANVEYIIGLMACISALFFSISPMPLVLDAIRMKSTKNLPFGLISSSFLVTFLWFIYGTLINNTFVMIPNGLGALIYTIQLSLYVIYPSDKSKIQ